MATKTWFGYLESTIFSKLKKSVTENYTGANWTTNEIQTTPTSFPTVEVRELEAVEMGQDLENTYVAAVLETIQVRIFTTDKTEMQKLSRQVVVGMKEMRFDVIKMPFVRNYDSGVYFAVGRFRRVIGAGDSELVITL